MPEVAIFHSEEMNAFATGASKNSALVAVSQGLLNNMAQGEIEAVLGHEMSHIANGDGDLDPYSRCGKYLCGIFVTHCWPYC
jgi:Zn-dependent protease with chaperone function